MSDATGKSFFNLTEEQFWKDPLYQKNASNFGSELLLKQKEGMFIDMPQVVYSGIHKTIPLCGWQSGSKDDLKGDSFNPNAILAVVHLESGEINEVMAAPPQNRLSPAPSPGWTVQSLTLDLANWIYLGPSLGKYQAIVLWGKQSSNTRTFELLPDPSPAARASAIKAIENIRSEGAPAEAIIPGTTHLVRHVTSENHLGPIPIWKLSSSTPGKGHCRFDLEFLIKGLPRFLYPKTKPQIDSNKTRIFGMVPIRVIAFDEKKTFVISEKFELPIIHPPAGTDREPILGGKISIDLMPFLDRSNLPKSLTVWALGMDQKGLVELKIP